MKLRHALWLIFVGKSEFAKPGVGTITFHYSRLTGRIIRAWVRPERRLDAIGQMWTYIPNVTADRLRWLGTSDSPAILSIRADKLAGRS